MSDEDEAFEWEREWVDRRSQLRDILCKYAAFRPCVARDLRDRGRIVDRLMCPHEREIVDPRVGTPFFPIGWISAATPGRNQMRDMFREIARVISPGPVADFRGGVYALHPHTLHANCFEWTAGGYAFSIFSSPESGPEDPDAGAWNLTMCPANCPWTHPLDISNASESQIECQWEHEWVDRRPQLRDILCKYAAFCPGVARDVQAREWIIDRLLYPHEREIFDPCVGMPFFPIGWISAANTGQNQMRDMFREIASVISPGPVADFRGGLYTLRPHTQHLHANIFEWTSGGYAFSIFSSPLYEPEDPDAGVWHLTMRPAEYPRVHPLDIIVLPTPRASARLRGPTHRTQSRH